MPKVNVELTPFDPADAIADDSKALAYLSDALDSNDHRVVTAALGSIARAQGATGLVKAAGISRAALYNSLAPDGNSTLATMMAVLDQLGLRLRVEKLAA